MGFTKPDGDNEELHGWNQASQHTTIIGGICIHLIWNTAITFPNTLELWASVAQQVASSTVSSLSLHYMQISPDCLSGEICI